MEPGMMALLGKTVALMENIGFLWIVTAGLELGLWEALQGEKTLAELQEDYPNWDHVLLEHWLDQAVCLELLQRSNSRYKLTRMGKAVQQYRGYGLEAMYKEFTLYWSSCFAQLPQLITREAGKLDLDAQMEDELISRASVSAEPFVWPLLKAKFQKEKWRRVLDVGCGEGLYLCELLAFFPELKGVGLEINPVVAERAREKSKKFKDRVEIACGDAFDFTYEPESFDICLLNNNIYYFEQEQRLKLLNKLKPLLRPGGHIGILTALRGIDNPVQLFRTYIPQNLMSLFLACHEGFTGLPTETGVKELLREAGFADIEVVALPLKVSSYFFARRPENKKTN